MKSLVVFLALVFSQAVYSQSVLVSEYFYLGTPDAGQWTELLVVQDNLDMRGMFLTDNSSSQSARQGGVRFKNIDYWKNVRAGTIIGIWHRTYKSNLPSDSDAVLSDGRIMLAATDTNYFEQIRFSTSFPWNQLALYIATGGDFLEVLSKDTVHVHAIGHIDGSSPGSFWFVMPAPKTEVFSSCPVNNSNRVYPGSSLADYNGPNLEIRSQICGTYVTRTLPNKDCNTGASNVAFWHSLRQPSWVTPALQMTISATQVNLNWNSMVDPNPTDGIQGYMIVRDSGTTPFNPVDGRVYTNGERVGSAVVLAHQASGSLNYTDVIDLPCGVIYTYRVFAYRYGLDDEYGVNTAANTARGRQYNRDNVAFREAFKPVASGPKLQYTAGQNVFCEGSSLNISVPQQSGFTAQWMQNGTDINGETGWSLVAKTSGQYRLKMKNAQGCLVLSDSVDVVVNALPVVEISPRNLSLCKDSTALIQASPSPDYTYQWLLNGSVIPGATNAQYMANQSGDYSVKVSNALTGCSSTSAIATIKPINVSLSSSTQTINFTDLADCVSFADDPSSLQITNTSTTDSLHLTALEPGHFSIVSPRFPLALGPGQKINVVVRFTPTNSSTTSETMSFVASPCGATVNVTLSGRKPGVGTGLSTNVSSRDFGVIAWCQAQSSQDSVQLIVTKATDITAISVEAPFSVSAADAAGFHMNAGDKRTIKVTFNSLGNPALVAAKDLVVRFKTGQCDDSIKVNLRGAFTLPQLLVDVSVLNLPSLDSCSLIIKDTVVHITNNSAIDVDLSQINDANLSIVEISGTSTLKIKAGETVAVTLRFAPNGFQKVSNKRITLSATPCIDLSGFVYNGERSGVTVSSDVDSLYYGTVSICNGVIPSAKTFRLKLQSFNNASATVTDIRFSAPWFSTDLKPGQVLSSDAIVNVSLVGGAGQNSGKFNESMFVTLSPCGVQQEIHLAGEFAGDDIRLTNSTSRDTLLDFGTTDIGSPIVRTLYFTNYSSFAITLGQLPSTSPGYSLSIQPAAGSTVLPGQQITLTFTFSPSTAGIFNRIVAVPIVGPCVDSLNCSLHGVARSQGLPPVAFHFLIGNYTAAIGDTIRIPIQIVGTDLKDADLQNVGIDFVYNRALLRVLNVTNAPMMAGYSTSLIQTANGIRISAIGSTTLVSSGDAFNVQGVVLLGDALQTPLSIDTTSIDVHSSALNWETPQNGSLSLTGHCNITQRLLNVAGKVGITALRYSNNTLQCDYETVGEQWTTIELFNQLGERVAVLVDSAQKPGSHTQESRIENCAQGAYFIRFSAGNASHTQGLMLLR